MLDVYRPADALHEVQLLSPDVDAYVPAMQYPQEEKDCPEVKNPLVHAVQTLSPTEAL